MIDKGELPRSEIKRITEELCNERGVCLLESFITACSIVIGKIDNSVARSDIEKLIDDDKQMQEDLVSLASEVDIKVTNIAKNKLIELEFFRQSDGFQA
jgi:hypothetical protein